MSAIKPWIIAARPKTLLAGLSPVILSFAYLSSQKISLSLSLAIYTLLCTILMQIGTNYVNDAIDAKTGVDSEKRLGPVRAVQAGLLSIKQMTWGYRLCFLAAFLFGIPLMLSGGKVIIFMGLVSLLMAYIYTGGPLPLSHYGLGELLAFFFFGPWPIFGSLYLQSGVFYFESLILGLSVGLASAALMAVNNLRDRENDRHAGKTTIATLISLELAQKFTFLLILVSAFLTPLLIAYFDKRLHSLIALLPYFLFLKEWRAILKGKSGVELNHTLAKVGAFLFLSALLLSVSLLL